VNDRDFSCWRETQSFDTVAGRIDVIPVAVGIGAFDDDRDSAVDLSRGGSPGRVGLSSWALRTSSSTASRRPPW